MKTDCSGVKSAYVTHGEFNCHKATVVHILNHHKEQLQVLRISIAILVFFLVLVGSLVIAFDVKADKSNSAVLTWKRLEMKTRTSEKLALAMEQAGCPVEMINKAKNFYYDDYKSELATPCIQLVMDLAQYPELKIRAMNGEFDAQRWESDEWAESEEGRESIASLGPAAVQILGIKYEN